MTHKIILDTDPGIDDAMAILFAEAHPAIDLLAITTVFAVLAAFDFQLGRDTGCALLAAMLAIKPSETRSLRDARSLVGFALFAPFATFLLDQGPLSLVLGLIALVVGLLTLQRLADVESQIQPVPASSKTLQKGGH